MSNLLQSIWAACETEDLGNHVMDLLSGLHVCHVCHVVANSGKCLQSIHEFHWSKGLSHELPITCSLHKHLQLTAATAHEGSEGYNKRLMM